MKSALSFWRGKVCAALGIVLLLVVCLNFYKTSLISDALVPESSPQYRLVGPAESAEDALVEKQEEMQQVLGEQTRLLEEIASDVDSVNKSLNEITDYLQENPHPPPR